MRQWSIRDAQYQLSELVEAAQRTAQAIAKHGRQIAVVLSSKENERLRSRLQPLASFFAGAGLEDVEIEQVKATARGEGEL